MSLQKTQDRTRLWQVVALLAVGVAAGCLLQSGPSAILARQRPSKIGEDLYFGVNRGMMVPFFGIRLPDGFVWADGKSTWPKEDWVPEHLRGKLVPDMNGYLIGGTDGLERVGRPWVDGKLTLPEWTVNFGQASLAKEPWSSAGEGNQSNGSVNVFKWDARGSGPMAIHLITEDLSRKNIPLMTHVGERQPDQGSFNPTALSDWVSRYSGIKGSQAIGGNTMTLGDSATNPRHVMCRWVIRIR